MNLGGMRRSATLTVPLWLWVTCRPPCAHLDERVNRIAYTVSGLGKGKPGGLHPMAPPRTAGDDARLPQARTVHGSPHPNLWFATHCEVCDLMLLSSAEVTFGSSHPGDGFHALTSISKGYTT